MEEIAPRAEGGALLLDPGRGVSRGRPRLLARPDPRPAWLREDWHGASTSDFLVGLGASAAAEAAGLPVEGRRVAIEGFGAVGLALARLVADRGGSVVAVATGAGAQVDEGGFDVAALGEAWVRGGEGMVKAGSANPTPAWTVFGTDADLLFVGSKAGALTHEGTDGVKAKGVIPIGPVPFTTKALLALQRASVTVVPDFVALAGPHLAAQGGAADPAAAAEATTEGITEVVEAAGGPRGRLVPRRLPPGGGLPALLAGLAPLRPTPGLTAVPCTPGPATSTMSPRGRR